MTFLFVCLLAGFLLGQRFKVLILLPATVVVTALSLAGGEWHWPIALMALAAIVSLQMGYLLGVGAHCVLNTVSRRAGSLASSTPTRRPAQ